MKRVLRTIRRLTVFGVILGLAFIRFLVFARNRTSTGRAEWLQDTCRRIGRAIGLETHVDGHGIAQGLLVSNHLSYLDVIVIGALHPCAFLSKAEVRSWPAIGWAARAAGTLFVRRESRADIARAAASISRLIKNGGSVMVFPEGTSTDGSRVLPFHPGVFDSVAGSAALITPIRIAYRLRDGDPAEEVCYWRDMTFVPHFLRLLGKERVIAEVRIGDPFQALDDRKALARAAHSAVVNLAESRVLKPAEEFLADAVRN